MGSADQTKRVTGRVEEDPEAAVGGRLVIMPAGSGSQHRRLGCIDVGHRKVQVELLGMGATRPGRRDPVVDPLERQTDPAVVVGRAQSDVLPSGSGSTDQPSNSA